MIFGFLAGLGAATSQSFSYLGIRHYVQRRPAGAAMQLLILGHIWMALFALVLLPFCWPTAAIPWRAFLPPFIAATILYTAGQLSLAIALKHAEASRVSPLMTSKLIVTGTLTALFGQPLGDTSFITPLQWFAVLLCLIAGISINYTGGRMKTIAILAVAGAASSFSLSDWNINLMIKALLMQPAIDRLHASLLTEALSYLFTGLLVVPLLKPLGTRKPADWIDAVPFAAAWFIAMIFLFIAFSSVGIMLGSILQCTRSFITIGLAAAFMYRGHEHIEPRQPRSVILRRFAAGFLMFIGITLYVIRDPAQFRMKAAGTGEGSRDKGAKIVSIDAYHELLTSRYVCENCLTRYFVQHRQCAACKQFGRIRPLQTHLQKLADNDAELRKMIARGQYFVPPTNTARTT